MKPGSGTVGTNIGLADWRRDNINHFVAELYHDVKALKPSVRVGISPFGIWRPHVPETIEAQLDAFSQLFADSRLWLQKGWCDYLAPQLYWPCAPAKQSFPVLLEWWRAQSTAGHPRVARHLHRKHRRPQFRGRNRPANPDDPARLARRHGAGPHSLEHEGPDARSRRRGRGAAAGRLWRTRRKPGPLIQRSQSMALQHLHLPSVDERCAYLPGVTSTTEYRILSDVSPTEHERFLELGWRHFGAQYFRPVCAACQECVSLRIPVDTFIPTKSQRRAWKKCGDLRVKMGVPVANAERLELYHAWHSMHEDSRGWDPSSMTMQEYEASFCRSHSCAREFAYYDGDRLVGVGLVDVTPNAMSSTYFYYHPDCRPRGLGVASVLFEIFWARENDCAHVYLGYCVRSCPSTAYKSQYGPHEILVGRPEFTDRAVWQPGL